MKQLYLYGSLAVLALVIGSVSFLTAHAAPAPSAAAQAALDLPRVIKVIEDTQAAHDRNEQAKVYKAQLIACVDHNDCDSLKAPSSRPL